MLGFLWGKCMFISQKLCFSSDFYLFGGSRLILEPSEFSFRRFSVYNLLQRQTGPRPAQMTGKAGIHLENILQAEHLYGGYLIRKPVLRDLTFSVNKGEMVGLIGLNGAGKSTTIKHILGLLQPQQGRIAIRGKTLQEDPDRYRSAFAYVPESPELYDELTIREHLELTAMAYGLEAPVFAERMERLLDLFRMREQADSFPSHLSKGMRQKVMIMNAFLVEPPLYIIDEPFLGLDPLGIRSLLELMVSFKNAGASFLISSHILSTIEKYCDRFVVLHRGEILAQGTLAEINAAAGRPGLSLDDLFVELVSEGSP
jgi:ABC-2 type transport system ATP-binding protein